LQRRQALAVQLGAPADLPAGDFPARFPELAAAGERDSAAWEEEVERRQEAIRANRSDRRAVAGVRPVRLATSLSVSCECSREKVCSTRRPRSSEATYSTFPDFAMRSGQDYTVSAP
jgi:hypothetical protein